MHFQCIALIIISNAGPVHHYIHNMVPNSIFTLYLSLSWQKRQVTVNGQYVVVAEKKPSFCNITEALSICQYSSCLRSTPPYRFVNHPAVDLMLGGNVLWMKLSGKMHIQPASTSDVSLGRRLAYKCIFVHKARNKYAMFPPQSELFSLHQILKTLLCFCSFALKLCIKQM